MRYEWQQRQILYRYTPQVNSSDPRIELFATDANVATAHYNNAEYTYQLNLMAAVYALIAPRTRPWFQQVSGTIVELLFKAIM